LVIMDLHLIYSFYYSSLSWCYGFRLLQVLSRRRKIIELYETKCLHCSTMEGLATNAEEILSNTCKLNTCKIIKIKSFGSYFWM
jgi:hypothetical protein